LSAQKQAIKIETKNISENVININIKSISRLIGCFTDLYPNPAVFCFSTLFDKVLY